jgi:toxin ParE1/3/4
VILRHTIHALADLDHVLGYIADRSPQGARKVHLRIRAIVDLLRRHPRLGTPTEDPVIRRVTTLPFPYLILYEVAQDEIIVHAIRHGARDPSGMPGAEDS